MSKSVQFQKKKEKNVVVLMIITILHEEETGLEKETCTRIK